MIIRGFEAGVHKKKEGDSELFQHQKSCPICQSADIEFSLLAHDSHYGVDGEYAYHECANCGCLFLNPLPSEKFLAKAYPTDYYAYQEPKGDGLLKKLVKKILFLSRETKDPVFTLPGTMLDIGCGSGDFLIQMLRIGWKTYGVEPSESAAAIGNKIPGLNIHNGTLTSAQYPSGFFDYVRSNHSLEHMPNPVENLCEIARIIKPSGKLFIGVPNSDGLAFSWFKRYWWNLGAPQHPINYNRSSLDALVIPFGFKRVSFRTNSDFTGILGSFQIKINNKRGKKSSFGPVFTSLPLKVMAGLMSKMIDMIGRGDCMEIVYEKI